MNHRGYNRIYCAEGFGGNILYNNSAVDNITDV